MSCVRTNGLVIFLFSCEDLNIIAKKKKRIGNSLAVQWLGLGAYIAGGLGSTSRKLRGTAKKKEKNK